MLEEIPVLIRVVLDDGAIELRSSHRVERDTDAINRDYLIALDRFGSVAEAIAAATAAGGEGDAKHASIEIVTQTLCGCRGELEIHSDLGPWTMRHSASSRLNQSRSILINSSSRS